MRLFLLPMLAACLWLAPVCARAEDAGKKEGTAIAVIDFDYVDTLRRGARSAQRA